jgi:hypothetical protein
MLVGRKSHYVEEIQAALAEEIQSSRAEAAERMVDWISFGVLSFDLV